LLATRFGSVSKALRLAGIAQVPHGRRHTEEEVFENLLGVWTHYGRPPTHSEMDKPPSTVGSNTYIKRYGGWRNALKAFVTRANSDVAGLSELSPDKTNLANLATRPHRAVSATAATRPLTGRRITERPRAPRLMSTDAESANRRDPSIGLRFKVLQRDRFRCQLCGRSPATELGCKLHVDHIVPFSKEGKTTFENLRALCAECNVGRGNRGG
jgi:5-methylcytosine-specific restriction endonuclease McrA